MFYSRLKTGYLMSPKTTSSQDDYFIIEHFFFPKLIHNEVFGVMMSILYKNTVIIYFFLYFMNAEYFAHIPIKI